MGGSIGPPSLKSEVLDPVSIRPGELPGLADELDELAAIAGAIGLDGRLGELDDGRIAEVASRRGVAQEHPEPGDGGGELEVVGGLA